MMNRTRLSLATLALAALTLGSCDKGTAPTATTTTTDSTTVTNDSTGKSIVYNGKIVYVQIDSLQAGYGMAQDLQQKFQEKGQKVQNQLTARGRSIERELREYQEKAQKGLVTRFQAQDIETGLAKKQQSLMEYRERMMQELAEEEVVITNQIRHAILDYVERYNAEKKYSMIIAGGVLTADPSLDITSEILEGLNNEYRAKLDSTQNKSKK